MKSWFVVAATLLALMGLWVNTTVGYAGGAGHGGGGQHDGGSHSYHPPLPRPKKSGTHGGASHAHTNTNHHHTTNDRHSTTHHASPDHPANHHTTTNHHTAHNHGHHVPGHGHTVAKNYHPYHYSHHHGGDWTDKDWQHAWTRHWYHVHYRLWNGGYVWWDPDASAWVAYDANVLIPEDYYVVGDEPPAKHVGRGAIRIANPADQHATVAYAINDNPYMIEPGEEQDLDAGQEWTIKFDRGRDNGSAEYALEPGEYDFGHGDHGLELYRTADVARD